MDIGHRMKLKRIELKRHPKEVAQAIHVSVETLYRMERGQSVTTSRIERICKELGLTPNELFSWEEAKAS